MTFRDGGHHVNDPGLYLPAEQLAHWKARDPLVLSAPGWPRPASTRPRSTRSTNGSKRSWRKGGSVGPRPAPSLAGRTSGRDSRPAKPPSSVDRHDEQTRKRSTRMKTATRCGRPPRGGSPTNARSWSRKSASGCVQGGRWLLGRFGEGSSTRRARPVSWPPHGRGDRRPRPVVVLFIDFLLQAMDRSWTSGEVSLHVQSRRPGPAHDPDPGRTGDSLAPALAERLEAPVYRIRPEDDDALDSTSTPRPSSRHRCRTIWSCSSTSSCCT